MTLATPVAAAANTYDVDLPGSAVHLTAPDGLWLSELRWDSEAASETERVDASPGVACGRPFSRPTRRTSATTLPQGSRAVRVIGDGVAAHGLRPRVVDEHPSAATAISGSLTPGSSAAPSR